MNVIVENLIMSRSYRKTPIIKDNGKHKQFSKRQANKKVRHEICGNGAEYKRHFEQYDICDFYYFVDKKDKKAMAK